MKKLIVRLVVGVVVLCAIGLYGYYETAANYQKTRVKVTHVEEACYMRKSSLKETWTTKEGPCEIVESVHKNRPEFKDYSLKRVFYVGYRYQSPADGKWHKGRHQQAKHEDGRKIKPGDELTVLLHKQDPGKTKKF